MSHGSSAESLTSVPLCVSAVSCCLWWQSCRWCHVWDPACRSLESTRVAQQVFGVTDWLPSGQMARQETSRSTHNTRIAPTSRHPRPHMPVRQVADAATRRAARRTLGGMTTDAPLPAPGREVHTLDALDSAQAEAVLALLAEAARSDGLAGGLRAGQAPDPGRTPRRRTAPPPHRRRHARRLRPAGGHRPGRGPGRRAGRPPRPARQRARPGARRGPPRRDRQAAAGLGARRQLRGPSSGPGPRPLPLPRAAPAPAEPDPARPGGAGAARGRHRTDLRAGP